MKVRPMDKSMNMKTPPKQIIEDSKIEFYKAGCINGFYSNLFPSPFNDCQNKYWKTSEHYYQAHKFRDNHDNHDNHDIMEQLRNIKKPRDVSFAGRNNNSQIINTWDLEKDNIMRRALRYKFDQNNNLKQLLVESGDAEIIEVTEFDKYRGNGGDNTGLNKLGKLLMELRESYSKH